nr:protein kinase-like domain, phloem protein 2-like protein [Tanacetum cinerariifolium]
MVLYKVRRVDIVRATEASKETYRIGFDAHGKLGTKSDIYSFGVVLFEILYGKLAYDLIYTIEHLTIKTVITELDKALSFQEPCTEFEKRDITARKCLKN